ncbi:MAG: hypothetical protein ACPGVB_08325 [Chitinophagales bacterium]
MIVIFLTFLVVATSSPLNQGLDLIVKTGAFIHHFLHHIKCQNEKIGLDDFVLLHYFDHEHHEEDHENHEDLPFSHHHKKTVSTNLILFISNIGISEFSRSELSVKQNFFHRNFIPLGVISEIWKPPRFNV